jgi:hypothetical protein
VESSAAYAPAAQSAQLALAGSAPNLLAGQLMQSDSWPPAVGWCCPAGQSTHSTDAATAYLPFAQLLHDALALAAMYFPPGHAAQSANAAPTEARKRPPGQSVHEVDPATAYVLLSQAVHAVLPSAAAY